MDPFRLLMFGNLLLLVIDKQMSPFFTQNIYLAGSLLLNIFLTVELAKISKMLISYTLFFSLAILGVVSAYLVLDLKSFSVVIVKFLWILTSVLILSHLVLWSNFKLRFEELRKFAIFVGYFVLASTLLAILIVDEPYVGNEGFRSLLISADNSKKLGLMVLPFLFLGQKRHILCGVLVIFYLSLGTRALVLSMLFSVGFIIIRFLKMQTATTVKQRLLIISLTFSFASVAVILAVASRSTDITSFLSTADRLATWSRYSQVIADYPLGLGPDGGYYLLRNSPERVGIDISFLTEIAVEQDLNTGSSTSIESLIDKRLKVSAALGARSAESIYIDFISSYGLMGFLVLTHLIFTLIKDFKYAVSSFGLEFPIIYGSFGGLLVLGLFNSFHSSMFFIVLLYVVYFAARRDRFDNVRR